MCRVSFLFCRGDQWSPADACGNGKPSGRIWNPPLQSPLGPPLRGGSARRRWGRELYGCPKYFGLWQGSLPPPLRGTAPPLAQAPPPPYRGSLSRRGRFFDTMRLSPKGKAFRYACSCTYRINASRSAVVRTTAVYIQSPMSRRSAWGMRSHIRIREPYLAMICAWLCLYSWQSRRPA